MGREELPHLYRAQESAVFDAAEILEGLGSAVDKPSFITIAELLRSIVDEEVAAAMAPPVAAR